MSDSAFLSHTNRTVASTYIAMILGSKQDSMHTAQNIFPPSWDTIIFTKSEVSISHKNGASIYNKNDGIDYPLQMFRPMRPWQKPLKPCATVNHKMSWKPLSDKSIINWVHPVFRKWVLHVYQKDGVWFFCEKIRVIRPWINVLQILPVYD